TNFFIFFFQLPCTNTYPWGRLGEMAKRQSLIFVLLVVGISRSNKTFDSKRNDIDPIQTSNTIRDWRTKISAKDMSTEVEPPKTQSIMTFRELNDSVTFCIISINDGVCNTDILATLINKNKGTETEIGKNCDQDLAWPKYEYKTYTILPDWTI